MTFDELLADGQQKLDELKRQRTAEASAADAAAQREAAEFWRDFNVGLCALLPDSILPYVEYPTDTPYNFYHLVTISAPDCAPIECKYRAHEHRFVGEKPFRVPSVRRGFYSDGEGYPPLYSQTRDDFVTDDIALAVAVSRVSHAQLTYELAEYEQRKADYEQAAAGRALTERQAADVHTAAPAPSLAEQLVALIRAIAREELAEFGCEER